MDVLRNEKNEKRDKDMALKNVQLLRLLADQASLPSLL